MIKQINKKKIRIKKHRRIRNRIKGIDVCPRLCVFRSNKNIYAQIIDDSKGHTLVSASSLELNNNVKEKEIKQLDPVINDTKKTIVKEKKIKGTDIVGADFVGKLLAKKALKLGIKTVVFDRSGYIYHGRIKALADGARKNGLKF